jgi:hypothetical protein
VVTGCGVRASSRKVSRLNFRRWRRRGRNMDLGIRGEAVPKVSCWDSRCIIIIRRILRGHRRRRIRLMGGSMRRDDGVEGEEEETD